MATTIDRNAYQFFREHAGYRIGHNAEDAASLARAESDAQRRGWHYDWQWDAEEWDPGDTDYTPTEVLGAVLTDANGAELASLWGIADPTPEYRRVVEAELAAEALSATRMGPVCMACGNAAYV